MKKVALVAIAAMCVAGSAQADIVINDFDAGDATPVTYYVTGSDPAEEYVPNDGAASFYGDFTDAETSYSARVTITSSGSLINGFHSGLGVDGGWDAGDYFEISFDQDVKLVEWYSSKASGDVFNVSSDDVDVKDESFTGGDPGTHAFTIDGTYSGVLDAGTAVRIENDPDAGGAAVFTGITVEVVPEPATMALLGLGGIGVLIRRRRRA